MEENRYRDTGATLADFIDEFLVICPRCKGCAQVRRLDVNKHGPFAPRRVACTHCGFTQDWIGDTVRVGNDNDPAVDSYFGLPLFLSAPCQGHILWAYNRAHLELLENYVRATLREQWRDGHFGWRNASLVNRLPKWMVTAKHRDAVLAAIAKLKKQLDASDCG